MELTSENYVNRHDFQEIQIKRRIYTNKEFLSELALYHDLPSTRLEFENYVDRVDTGLYYMGWDIYKSTVDDHLVFVAYDEMTTHLGDDTTEHDAVHWRAAWKWAMNVSQIYRRIQDTTRGLTKTQHEIEYTAFYEEHFLP